MKCSDPHYRWQVYGYRAGYRWACVVRASNVFMARIAAADRLAANGGDGSFSIHDYYTGQLIAR